MKRFVLIFLVALSLTGCATQSDVVEAYEKGRSVGYNEGYGIGFDDGFSVGYRYLSPETGKQATAYVIGEPVPAGSEASDKLYEEAAKAAAQHREKEIDKQATANAWRDPNWDGQPIYKDSGADATESVSMTEEEYFARTPESSSSSYNARLAVFEAIAEKSKANQQEDSDYNNIFTYGTDADSILDYIRDNPHEFNLYTESDMCDAHEAGANGEDWFVR